MYVQDMVIGVGTTIIRSEVIEYKGLGQRKQLVVPRLRFREYNKIEY